MVRMVRELSPCAFDAYAMVSGSSANGYSLLPPKRSEIVEPASLLAGKKRGDNARSTEQERGEHTDVLFRLYRAFGTVLLDPDTVPKAR